MRIEPYLQLCHLSIDRIDAVTSEDSEFPHNFGQTSNQKLPNNPNNYRFYLGLTFLLSFPDGLDNKYILYLLISRIKGLKTDSTEIA